MSPYTANGGKHFYRGGSPTYGFKNRKREMHHMPQGLCHGQEATARQLLCETHSFKGPTPCALYGREKRESSCGGDKSGTSIAGPDERRV